MNSLPIEVLMQVFSFLFQRDKLECMTVCRQWHDIIHHYYLFRNIYISSEEQLDQLAKRVKEDSKLGAKVERLIIELSLCEVYNAKNLIALFPNLHHFDLLTARSSPKFFDDRSKPYKNHLWCERIETITEEKFDFNTRRILSSGVCKNLTRIAVGGRSTFSDLVANLSNAPALKILYLNTYYVSFCDLEQLHKNSPRLHTLSLQKIYFVDTPVLLDVKPATSLKTLRFTQIYQSGGSNFGNRTFFYISQKYTQVENLTLDLKNIDFKNDNAGSEQRQKDEVVSYFQKLALGLKNFSLFINLSRVYSLSSVLDLNMFNECGVQIKTLDLEFGFNTTLFYQLVDSIKQKDIQSLSVYQSFKTQMHLGWLLEFTMLKKLTLGCSSFSNASPIKKLDLRDLLSNLGNTCLETLQLCNLNLELDSPNEPVVYPWLKEITLSNTTLPVGTDSFISGSFPNLKRLKLEDCFSIGDSFVLPSIDLCYLEIKHNSWSWCGRFTIILTTLSDNQSRFYKSGGKEYVACFNEINVRNEAFTWPSFSSEPLDTTERYPMLTIVCRSVYSFMMKITKSTNKC